MSVLKVQLAVLRHAQIKMVATRVLVVLAIAWLLMHMDAKVNTYSHCIIINKCYCYINHQCDIDVNECMDENLHTCEQLCNNAAATYSCLCFDGYELNSDGFSCSGLE